MNIIISEALRYGTCSRGISQFYLHTHTFIRNRDEPYLPLPSQPQLVLIYRPRRDGRLSRPWCEVALVGIRTRNLRIANPARYRTATSAYRHSSVLTSHHDTNFSVLSFAYEVVGPRGFMKSKCSVSPKCIYAYILAYGTVNKAIESVPEVM